MCRGFRVDCGVSLRAKSLMHREKLTWYEFFAGGGMVRLGLISQPR
jgi:hypothetical protein